MAKRSITSLFCCILLLSPYALSAAPAGTSDSEKVVIVIIDGARYSETFGNPAETYTPRMVELAEDGAVISSFYNDSVTKTYRAVPALWSGAWTEVRDTFYAGNQTNYGVKPSLFEYYRKQKNMPAEKCIYVLKSIQSLWLQSFDAAYGPDYWPLTHSSGYSDSDVADQAQWLMDTYHPNLLWVYLADVDSRGHSGDWDDYTTALTKADSIVARIWDKLQADPYYKDSTTLFVTNDHGRHDDEHGGFSHHGDGCPGCRQIMFLALGPQVKQNFTSTLYRTIPDMAVTAAHILGVEPGQATGEVMSELFVSTGMESPNTVIDNYALEQNYPNPFNAMTRIGFMLREQGQVELKVYNSKGTEVATLIKENLPAGSHVFHFDARNLTSGVYFYRLKTGNYSETKKMMLLK